MFLYECLSFIFLLMYCFLHRAWQMRNIHTEKILCTIYKSTQYKYVYCSFCMLSRHIVLYAYYIILYTHMYFWLIIFFLWNNIYNNFCFLNLKISPYLKPKQQQQQCEGISKYERWGEVGLIFIDQKEKTQNYETILPDLLCVGMPCEQRLRLSSYQALFSRTFVKLQGRCISLWTKGSVIYCLSYKNVSLPLG